MAPSPMRWLTLACAAVIAPAAPALGAVGDVTTFPTRVPGNAYPQAPTVGPDGALWFFVGYGTDPGLGDTALSKARTPRRRETGLSECCSRLIRVGLDGSLAVRGRDPFGNKVVSGLTSFAGSLWVSTEDTGGGEPARLWRYSISGQATAFPAPGAAGSLTTGPDGNLWYLFGSSIGRTSASGAMLASYAVNSSGLFASGPSVAWTSISAPALRRIDPNGSTTDFPVGFTVGLVAPSPDGSVWFGDNTLSQLGRLVPATGVVEATGAGSLAPSGIAVAPDGAAWATDQAQGRVIHAKPSLALQPFAVPGANSTSEPAIGSDGNLWFVATAGPGEHRIARMLTGIVPTVTRGPEAAGTVTIGQSVTVTQGQWNHAPTGYTYSWQRCTGTDAATCVAIPGASSATHLVTPDDIGRGLRARVTALNLNGASAPVESNIVTHASAPSNVITLGKPRRSRSVISVPVTVPGAGSLRMVGRVRVKMAKRKKPRVVRVCTSKPAATTTAGRTTLRCTLTPRARTQVFTSRRVVTLAVSFQPVGGTGATRSVRLTVPRLSTARR